MPEAAICCLTNLYRLIPKNYKLQKKIDKQINSFTEIELKTRSVNKIESLNQTSSHQIEATFDPH